MINHKGFKIRQKFIHIKLYSCHCPVEVANCFLALKCCCCCFSIAQSCLTLCDPLDCSTPGFPVLYHLLELAQTHVHWVGDAIQPSRPLLSLSSLSFYLSQHQGLLKCRGKLFYRSMCSIILKKKRQIEIFISNFLKTINGITFYLNSIFSRQSR